MITEKIYLKKQFKIAAVRKDKTSLKTSEEEWIKLSENVQKLPLLDERGIAVEATLNDNGDIIFLKKLDSQPTASIAAKAYPSTIQETDQQRIDRYVNRKEKTMRELSILKAVSAIKQGTNCSVEEFAEYCEKLKKDKRVFE